METISVRVNKQMDGYTFSILPSIRDLIKRTFPMAHPANRVFVAYDLKSDFEPSWGRIENYIPEALLDVSVEELKKVTKIDFIDTQTGKTIHSMFN